MNWDSLKMQAISFVTVYGLKILAAILILVIGRYLASIAGKVVKKAMGKAKTGDTLASFVGNIVYFGILIFVVIAAIGKLGVQTTSFVAIIGASGLAIGLALQGSLANFAAGVMMIIFHPFKVGDTITAAGVTGKVHDIQIFSSVILTPDNKKIIVPNSKLTGDIITNFTAMPTRRVDMTFTVTAKDEPTARQVIQDVLDKDEHVLKTPAPGIYLVEIADNKAADGSTVSHNFTYNVQPHAHNPDYGKVLNSVTEKMKLSFHELNKA